MKTVFADTCYWIAIFNRSDEQHEKATAISDSIGQLSIITSEMVLSELLNYFSSSGSTLRQTTVASIRKLQNDPKVTIVPQTQDQFRDALTLYSQRLDKEWSLTDCASILIMQEEKLAEALTSDQHFEQAGFKALLLK